VGKRKPVLLVLHPRAWAESDYGKQSGLVIHHASIGGPTPRKLSGTPTSDGYAEVITKEGLQDLYRKAEKFKPDFFLFWLHSGFHAEHLHEVKIRAPASRMLFWFGNHRVKLAGNVTRISKYISALFINSKEPSQFKLYHDFGIERVGTLYDGFDPGGMELVEAAPKYDCFFAGESYSLAQLRNEVLNFPGTKIRRDFILAVHKKFELAVHAARHESWPFPVLKEVYHPHHTAAMREAKITLNVNHFPEFRKAYTRRTIRSIFARRCHITLYIPGMEDDFENKKHLCWFHTIEEGLELIDYYLKHDEEREKIAWEGWRHACKHFTFRERLRDFEVDLRGFFPESFS
jgi:hypothetical protein